VISLSTHRRWGHNCIVSYLALELGRFLQITDGRAMGLGRVRSARNYSRKANGVSVFTGRR